MSLIDRKDYAEMLIKAHPELSDREIGRRTCINHETVGALRNPSQSGGLSVPQRKPGELDADIGLFDPIRFAKGATKQQKAVAGYIQRLVMH